MRTNPGGSSGGFPRPEMTLSDPVDDGKQPESDSSDYEVNELDSEVIHSSASSSPEPVDLDAIAAQAMSIQWMMRGVSADTHEESALPQKKARITKKKSSTTKKTRTMKKVPKTTRHKQVEKLEQYQYPDYGLVYPGFPLYLGTDMSPHMAFTWFSKGGPRLLPRDQFMHADMRNGVCTWFKNLALGIHGCTPDGRTVVTEIIRRLLDGGTQVLLLEYAWKVVTGHPHFEALASVPFSDTDGVIKTPIDLIMSVECDNRLLRRIKESLTGITISQVKKCFVIPKERFVLIFCWKQKIGMLSELPIEVVKIILNLVVGTEFIPWDEKEWISAVKAARKGALARKPAYE